MDARALAATPSGSLRRHTQTLLYESFRHAQGDQPTQVHFIHCYAHILRARRVPYDSSLKLVLRERTRRLRLPVGHASIPDPAQVRAQFEFWWLTMWDILDRVFQTPGSRWPTRQSLVARGRAVGGNSSMSSFTDDEMDRLAAAFDSCRSSDPTFDDILSEHLLPHLIRVEHNFQGGGTTYPERPRTDGGDVHESKLLRSCHRAAERMATLVDPIDVIYLAVCRRLDWLAQNQPRDPTYVEYAMLVDSYNAFHPEAPVAALHVSGTAGRKSYAREGLR